MMTRSLSRICLIALLAGLTSGCAGGFDGLESEGIELTDRIARLGQTAPEAMPVAGTASYAGIASVDFGPGADSFGRTMSRIALTADFGEGAVSGSMTDWAQDTNLILTGRLGGSLTIFGGTITGNEIAALATGRLSRTRDGIGQEGRVDLSLDGTFLGASANAIVGEAIGTVSYQNGDPISIDGVFAAERR